MLDELTRKERGGTRSRAFAWMESVRTFGYRSFEESSKGIDYADLQLAACSVQPSRAEEIST